jgi:hypothetical protein
MIEPHCREDKGEASLRWHRIDVDALDCIAVNVAVLLDFAGVRDVRTPFAAEWHFSFDPARNAGRPALMRSPLVESISRYAGCTVESHVLAARNGIMADLARLTRQSPVLTFGDAYHMPWLPYAGRQHMEHSVIIAGADADAIRIVDAYLIRTEWGDAKPLATSVAADALARSLETVASEQRGKAWIIRRTSEPAIDTIAVLRDNAAAIEQTLGDEHALRAFALHYHDRRQRLEALREFTLYCWLTMRSRQLHSRWLLDLARDRPDLVPRDIAESFERDLVNTWQKASEFAYIALRRAKDGRAPTEAAFRLIIDQIESAEIIAARSLSAVLAASALAGEDRLCPLPR